MAVVLSVNTLPQTKELVMESSVLTVSKGTNEDSAFVEKMAQDGKWVAEIRVASFMKAHPQDQRTPRSERPLIVPVRHWAQLLGVSGNEVSTFLKQERQTTPNDYGYVSIEQTWTLVADRPFVAVHFRDHDEWKGDLAKLHRRMTTARQMHKGELGQRPELVRKPKTIQSLIPDPDKGHWNNSDPNDPEYIHPNLNWVELSELVEIVELNAEEIIRGFAGFSPSTYYTPNVPLLRGMLRQEDMVRVYVDDVPKSFCGGEIQWGNNNAVPLTSLQQVTNRNDGKVWVPQSFAYTVIRLVQFGYRPNRETPELSFRFEAPMPTVPETKMPVLSVEQLRELHDFRLKLDHELDKETFRSTVEHLLGVTNWQRRADLSDELNGFAYYTNFEVLEAFDGRLQVAVCYWTRGGAYKTPNYWAGFASVHPERPSNARHDPNAQLRIWFWPGELYRYKPTGMVGGLCRELANPDIATAIQKIVANLGYRLNGAA